MLQPKTMLLLEVPLGLALFIASLLLAAYIRVAGASMAAVVWTLGACIALGIVILTLVVTRFVPLVPYSEPAKRRAIMIMVTIGILIVVGYFLSKRSS